MRTFLRIVLKPLSFLPAILMMYLIFSFSAQDADTSSQLSYKVSHKIIEIGAEVIGADFEEWEIDSLASRFHGPIRKIAHMTEYFALAVSVAFPLYVYGLRGILLVIVAGFFCVSFACGDEYHQSQVAGRSPSKRDVAIDSIGIFAGIIFTRIVGWTGRKTIFRPLAKKKKKGNNPQYQNDSVPYNNNPQYYNSSNNSNTHYNNDLQYRNGNAQYSNYPQYFNNNAPYHNNPQYYNGNAQYNNNPQYYNGNAPHNVNPIYNNGTGSYNGNAPYNGNVPYNGNAPYNSNASYYNGNTSYNGYPSSAPQYRPIPDAAENPDSLSEDMSFKKLMHEIKDQKKTVHTEKRSAKKPKLEGEDVPDDFADLHEVDLDEINLDQ